MKIEIQIGNKKYEFEEYTFGEPCPECNNTNTIKRNRGELPMEIDFFTFFACPKCGYAKGEGTNLPDLHGQEFWNKLMVSFGRIIGKENVSMKDIYTYVESINKKQ